MTSKIIERLTDGRVKPKIDVVDNGQPATFTSNDKLKIKPSISRLTQLLNITKLIEPRESLERLILNTIVNSN